MLLHLQINPKKHALMVLFVQIQVLLPSRPHFKNHKKTQPSFQERAYLSWAALSFITQSLWFTSIPALPSVWPQILLMHLGFRAGLAGNHPNHLVSVCRHVWWESWSSPCVRCHGAHATPSLEPSPYRGRARREGGVDGSGCPLLRCVIGALLHL